ncbi:MAG: hypothetical protein R2709_03190 [Marmoricola sp.]
MEQGFVDKVLEDDSRIKAVVSKEKSVRIDSVIKPPKPSYAKPADLDSLRTPIASAHKE